ncbi:MAG: glycosyltransferase family 39 protein, partial [Anaerolineales bacterium]
MSAVVQYHVDLGAGIVWPFLALALGLLVRGYFLSQPMRGDEAYTFLHYVNQGFLSLFDYSAPNNHVLNTLLIKLSASFWGASPASIRFPAFLAGLAAIVLAFYLARCLGKDSNSGILVAITSAVFPYLILYSTNARGYSLIVALTLLMAWVGYRFSNDLSKSGLLLLALISALGMLAIPVMILPVAGIFLWIVGLLLTKKTPLKTILSRFVIPFGVLSAALTLVFYTPVIAVSNGVASIISNKFIEPQSWEVFLAQLLPQLQKSFIELSRDVPPAVLLTVLALVVLGLVASARRRNWGVLLILPCLVLGAFFVLLVQHTSPYARTWIYVIPFILLVADAGLVFLLEHVPGRFQVWANAFLVFAGLFFALNLMSENIIVTYADTSAFPEAPIVVEYLKPIFKPGDTLRVSPTADWSVYFYFWYDGISSLLTGQSNSTGRIFFISKKSRGPLEDAAAQR